MKLIEPLTINDTTLHTSNVPETDWPAWNAGTAYVVDQKVIRTSTHRVYKRLIAGTTAATPELDAVNWQDIAPTNKWAMFDGVVGTLTTKASSIVVSVQGAGLSNSIALLDIDAANLGVTVIDSVDGLVYDNDFSLTSPDGITDWYAYFFTPINRLTSFLVEGLPGYLSATIGISLTSPGGDQVSVGTCVVGTLHNLGVTKYGASAGIQDYSRKERDAFGNYSVTERAFNNKARFSFEMQAGWVDRVHSLLARRRALPTVYIGSTEYQKTMLYGFYKDFDIVISYPTFSECSLEIEGLT